MADIIKGYTFSNNEVVTPAKVHQLVDDATVADGSITTAKLANSLVTTAKIADANVTEAKLANNSITAAKLRDSAALSVIGNSTNASADPADIAAGTDGHVLRRSGTTLGFGQVATEGIADSAITNAKVASNAQIAGSKISNDFGARSIFATGPGNGFLSTAYGSGALTFGNSSNFHNTAIGAGSLYMTNSGFSNTAVGVNSLKENTTGFNNTAVGVNTLTGNSAESTAIGYNSLSKNTTGTYNTAVGSNSLLNNTTGINCTALGYAAGEGTTTSTTGNTTGSNNTFIGYQAVGSSATANNTITLGNSSVATLRCQVTSITALSDERDKTNIVAIPAGLDFVKTLRPVSFDWNMRSGKKVGIKEFGFIAQELQAAQKTTGISVPNLVSEDNPDALEASPGTLIPILVKAVQELAARVEALEAAQP